MTLAPALQWVVFGLLSAVALGGALGMTTTMGMFRSGVFLMASFLGVAGLFLLLSADLLGWLQVMMYVGGMLVMILFMVLVSSDPGGDRMASMMQLRGPERLFSRGLERAAPGKEGKEGMAGMPMEDMSMFTPVKRAAMVLSAALGAVLALLLALRRTWPASPGTPPPDTAREIGLLLMGKYMLLFEAAGLLILLGVFGSVFLARPGAHPDPADRARSQAKLTGELPPAEAAGPDRGDRRP